MTSIVLDGSLPVKPFDPASFVGTVEADGQRPKVAALVCELTGVVVCLSIVGAANSVSATLAKLLDPRGRLFFEPTADVAWGEPRILLRDTALHYKELSVRLRGTTAVHGLTLPYAAHLGDGLVHPPALPQSQSKANAETATPHDTTPDTEVTAQAAKLRAAFAQAHPRYLFGNVHEATPHWRSFLGVLRGLRAVVVNAPPDAPDLLHATMRQWADALWYGGIKRGLIVPLPALGMRGWRISGDLGEWTDVISEGVRSRWLSSPI